MISFALILLVSYLIGSIPTSILVTRWVKNVDIRTVGSGNAGGTNVFRALGWQWGIFVILADMLKGIAATNWVTDFVLAHPVDALPEITVIWIRLAAGIAAMIGHIYTVFANFKGGKGVSTAGGVMFGLAPITMIFILALFLTILLITRYVSVGSMLSGLCITPVIAIRRFVFDAPLDTSLGIVHDSVDTPIMVLGVVIAIGLIYTHRTNITRLKAGTENRIPLFGNTKKTEAAR
jgi:acyl phosphate:glycerol-3-phosphate acyltransferase